MALNVDKPGGDYLSSNIDTPFGRRLTQQARWFNRRDAIAFDGNIAQKPSAARAIHHAPIFSRMVPEVCASTLRIDNWPAYDGKLKASSDVGG